MSSKIIFFELNEVPWRIIQYFQQANPRSTLSKILPDSRIYDTFAEDTSLSPWITWPTVHRGVTDARHGIHSFGQPLEEIDKEFPTIWQSLAGHGFKVGVFGSLHTYPLPQDLSNYTFFFPDVFAAGAECFPETLSAFQDFNLTMSRASARNVSTSIPWKQAMTFLAALPGLGITGSTLADVAKHVVSERLNNARSCRRRTYQVVLAFDIFMKQLARTKPDFCTFFTNHVASSMHRYWAAAFPDDYSTFGFSNEWIDSYKDEIFFTMSKFDQMLGRLVSFLNRNPEYELWLATSMGQAATTAEPLESQLYITDVPKFMRFLQIQGWEQRPAMAPDISLRINPDEDDLFTSKLDKLLILGKPIRYERKHGFVSLSLGQPNLKDLTAQYDGRSVPFLEMGMANVVIEDQTNSTAYHDPNGCLIVYGRGPSGRTQISTTDVFKGLQHRYGLSSTTSL